MDARPDFILFIVLMVTVIISGLYRWSRLSRADKWLCFLMIMTLIQELIAFLAAKFYHNNFFTYYVYSPLEFLVICLYFNESVPALKQRNAGIWLGCGGLLVGLADALLQSMSGLNSFFLLFEGMFVILLCLFSFFQSLQDDDVVLFNQVHFWVTVCFLCYWSITYASFGLYNILVEEKLQWAGFVLLLSNLLFYTSVLILFLRYPKLRPSGE